MSRGAGVGSPMKGALKGMVIMTIPFAWRCMVEMTTEETRTEAERLPQVKATVFG